MAEVATAKQTGQGGTTFEDKTAAYFMACMLSETMPFGPEYSYIKKISFQVRPDGWLFDDLLLTCETSAQVTRNIAISIKSNQQTNTMGCAAEINTLLWEQYLHHNSTVFNKDNDALCLIEAPIQLAASDALHEILRLADNQDATTFHNRVLKGDSISAAQQKMYKSFNCPDTLFTTYGVTESETGNLLKCFIEKQMDFERVTSDDETTTIKLCREIVKNKDAANAQKLYQKLCLLPREFAPVAGSIDKAGLAKMLHHEFELDNFHSYQADWKKLIGLAAAKFSLIPNKIGQTLELDRQSLVPQAETDLHQHKGLLIQGISGSGKTNLAKQLAQKKQLSHPVIWLDSGDFGQGALETNLGLKYPLAELISQSPTKEGYLFIDGVERLYHAVELQKLAFILKTIEPAAVSWKVVLTCPSDQLDKIKHLLSNYNLGAFSFNKFELPPLSVNELLLIADTFPVMRHILFKDSMSTTRNNLKLMDKLAQNSANLAALSATSNIGESHLVDFVWGEEIDAKAKGLQMSAFMKGLSEKQADLLTTGINTRLFSADQLAPADELKNLHLIRLENESIYFNHDLYGDWARYKLLKSHVDQLPSFLADKKISSPLWAKAVKLMAISLLEADTSTASWNKIFLQFNDQSAQHVIVQDLFLEAFFFAPNAYHLLKMHREFLFADKAALFRRITKLFLLKATQANPIVLEKAKEIGIFQMQATAFDRLPVFEYWPAMIRFIEKELAIVQEHDLMQAVGIASLWLEKTPFELPFRNEAAKIAMVAAEKIIAYRKEGTYVDSDISKPVYKALLLGFAEEPAKAEQLLLQVAKREKKTLPDTSVSETKANKGAYIPSVIKPWPHGPAGRIDESFRELCLDGSSLITVMRKHPALAAELLLAVMIQEPRESRHWGYDPYERHFDLHEEHSWFPPFFLRGPFLNFLRLAPNEAMLFTCKLVDFATERWAALQASNKYNSFSDNDDNDSTKENIKMTIEVDGNPSEFLGNHEVYNWHKGNGNVPHSLASTLMALQQFFYEQLDAGNDICAFASLLINNTNSVGIIGLLMSLGRYYPALFLKELLPFTVKYEFYEWDYHMMESSFFGNDFSTSWQLELNKWKERLNRNLNLKDTMIQMMVINDDLQELFVKARPVWQSQLAALEADNKWNVFLYQIIPQFDPANHHRKDKEDGSFYFDYTEPAEVHERLTEGREQSMKAFEDIQLPYAYRQAAENNQPLDLSGAEKLWARVQADYKKIDTSSSSWCSEKYAFACPYANVLAGVHLLLKNSQLWKGDHPEYIDWMHDLVESMIGKQFVWEGQFEPYGTNRDWNNLLAEVVVGLWKEDVNNKRLRKAVAGVLLLFNASTLNSFFTAATASFAWNDNQMVGSQNLLLHYATFYYKYVNDPERAFAALQTGRQALCDAFVEDRLAPVSLDWSAVRAPQTWKVKEVEHWEKKTDYVRRSGINTFFLKPMIDAIPDISKKEGPEKEYIIAFLDQAFKQVLYKLGEIQPDSLAIRSLPNEFDTAVLSKTAKSLLDFNNADQIKACWMPLFEFGYIAQEWVTRFCNSFFVNLDRPANYASMVQLLNEMAEFTYAAPTWNAKSGMRHEDFRICLMGFNGRMISVWKHDYSAFTHAAAALYRKWFEKQAYNPHAVEALLDFITTPSGIFLLKEGLVSLNFFFGLGLAMSQEKPPEGRIYVGHKELDDKLANTLAKLWSSYKQRIQEDQQTYNLYRKLIEYLIAIKNVIGIELQNSLLG